MSITAQRVRELVAGLAEHSPDVFRLVSDREPVTWVSVLLAAADEPEFGDLLEEAWNLRASEAPPKPPKLKARARRA
jgi:hypothetical protein